MPLPLSRTQVRKLGDRLRDAEDPPDEDRALLASVLGAYEEALTETEERLVTLRLPANTRLKNSGTIVEKLRRDPRMKLDAVQDLAGARIVLARGSGHSEQDRVRDVLVEAFREGDRVPRVTDRRAIPSHGYRAVHLVVRVAGVPVEIQVRTALQHEWAQYFEKLADRLGRGIRYGVRPERLDALLADERLADERIQARRLAADLVELTAISSDLIKITEEAPAFSDDASRTLHRVIDDLLQMTDSFANDLMGRIDEVLTS